MALVLFNLEEYEEAARTFEHLLEASPEDPESLNYLGLCLLELEDLKEALKAFEKAALFNPKNEEALYT